MGNHDLERESGKGNQAKGTMEKHFNQLFQLDRPYGVLEYESSRLFFVSTEPQPEDSCYQIQECYATEEQFNWLVKNFNVLPFVRLVKGCLAIICLSPCQVDAM